ncbi:hypothetical protein E2562_032385 [Oryza meyeriana var. granulata]|uniref:Nudix hydrolase domain-containing protein n=1 Tax=Oryza meyeriana var. granulata TaxID=110450 RepID=A0A6G1CAK8_9ORYZ|nr:hypothetical protein E2562_032385 [Oryza meyeriana var. granulata]
MAPSSPPAMNMACARQGRLRQRYEGCYRLVSGCIPYMIKEGGESSSLQDDHVLDRLQVLMISTPKRSDLIFPKGGWEDDESIDEAACREAFEEAGVKGDLSGSPLGEWIFKSKSKQNSCGLEGACKGFMFALQVTELLESWPEQTTHGRRWVPVEEAYGLCRYDWMREALDKLKEQLVFAGDDLSASPSPKLPAQDLAASLYMTSLSGEVLSGAAYAASSATFASSAASDVRRVWWLVSQPLLLDVRPQLLRHHHSGGHLRTSSLLSRLSICRSVWPAQRQSRADDVAAEEAPPLVGVAHHGSRRCFHARGKPERPRDTYAARVLVARLDLPLDREIDCAHPQCTQLSNPDYVPLTLQRQFVEQLQGVLERLAARDDDHHRLRRLEVWQGGLHARFRPTRYAWQVPGLGNWCPAGSCSAWRRGVLGQWPSAVGACPARRSTRGGLPGRW